MFNLHIFLTLCISTDSSNNGDNFNLTISQCILIEQINNIKAKRGSLMAKFINRLQAPG